MSSTLDCVNKRIAVLRFSWLGNFGCSVRRAKKAKLARAALREPRSRVAMKKSLSFQFRAAAALAAITAWVVWLRAIHKIASAPAADKPDNGSIASG
jgi:hypothetical protein